VRIGVIHGPNLNLLGTRDPDIYGTASLADVERELAERAGGLGIELVGLQSNHEGVLVDFVQSEADSVDGWLVNAAAYTHTSVALRDALSAAGRPLVEVHLSNILAREPFRRESLLAPIALGVIAGFGSRSYTLGLEALARHIGGAR
jgi:3-dehydroquinate dehydratase-2